MKREPQHKPAQASSPAPLSRAEQAKLAAMLESNPQRFKEQLIQMRAKQPTGRIKLFLQPAVLRDVNLENFNTGDLQRIDFTNAIFIAPKLPNAKIRDALLAKGAAFRGPYFVGGHQEELYKLKGLDAYHWTDAARTPTELKAKLSTWRDQHPGMVLDLAIMFPHQADLRSLTPDDFAGIRLAAASFDDALMTPELEAFFKEQGASIFKNKELINPPADFDPAQELQDLLKGAKKPGRF